MRNIPDQPGRIFPRSVGSPGEERGKPWGFSFTSCALPKASPNPGPLLGPRLYLEQHLLAGPGDHAEPSRALGTAAAAAATARTPKPPRGCNLS